MSDMPKTALVLGKFMPLHRGHEALLRFARGMADDLHVVVDNIPDPWVSAEKRCRWVRETVPDAQVFHLPQPNPQDPSEHPDFWRIWRESLLELLPVPPDFVVASENYGHRLAAELGAVFLPFDMARAAVPVSGTMLRDDLRGHWPMLSAAAKRDFTFRVCVFGPESVGKSTLTRQLAAHYRTAAADEYARSYIEARGEIAAVDMPLIAKGQQALIAQAVRCADRLAFTDTDALSTTVWSRWLFGASDKAVEKIADENPCDFYLLLSPDLPWVGDSVRYFEGRGAEFFADCRAVLERRKRLYAVVSGAGDARLQNAVAAVDRALPHFFQAACRN